MSDEAQKRTRASGDVLDYLIHEFEMNPNPTPEQRKECSERTGMSEKAIRIWFQNRRAKFRKLERQAKSAKSNPSQHVNSKGQPHAYSSSNNNSVHSSPSNSLTNVTNTTSNSHPIPSEINEKYCFVDCTSLSVGTWQRVKTGTHDNQVLLSSLVNLSPYTLNRCMNHVDLMVIFSKKNAEINYFFSAVSNNSKILFRIFYPLASIVTCSLLDSSIEEDSIELRLNLASKPKFSVFFFNGVNANLNQWSICDDFSENQQVSSAYYAPGGTSTPHVLVGKKESLHHLQNYIQMSKDYPFNAPMIGGAVDTEPLLHENVIGSRDSIDKRDFLHLVGSDRTLMNNTPGFNSDNNETWNDAAHSGPELGINGISHLVEPLQGDSLSPHSPNHLTGHSARFEGHKGTNGFDGQVFNDSPNFFHSVEMNDQNLQISHQEHKESGQDDGDQKHTHGENNMQDAHEALHELNHGPEPNSFDYEVEVDHSGFETNDLIIESSSLATHSPMPEESITGHADNFIDYNAHA